MATQSQIEILIKLRDEAAKGFDRLNEQITKFATESDKGTKAGEKFEGQQKKTETSSIAAGVAIGNLATMVGRRMLSAFTDTIAEANRLDSSLIGLKSVASALGHDVNATEAAAISLTKNGLLTMSEAAGGLKNLLSSGLSLDQAKSLMERLTESATFNRQAHYQLGEAVVATTEGIKNGNSVLADASGVTKNLSVMLKEAGISINEVGDAQKDGSYQTAIYNGFMRETAVSLGNVDRYLQTAAGSQSQFNANVVVMQQQIGKQLQPVLGTLLATLSPLVTVIGENADTIVPLGLAFAGVVTPILAMNAAARLGIGGLGGLATSAKTTFAVFAGVRSLSDARAGIKLVGESAGLTTAKLGPLGTAATVAGVGFAGWQLGRLIAQMFDLDNKIAGLVNRLNGVTAAQTALGQEIQRDTIARAVAKGADATIQYADAVQFLIDKDAIRLAQFNKAEDVQRRAIEAALRLGEITQEQANARIVEIEQENQANEVRSKRVDLAGVVASVEKRIRDEIEASGVSLSEMVSTLKSNETGFRAWAKEAGLSAEALKVVEDAAKAGEAAAKKEADAVDKAREEREKWTETLEAAGFRSVPQLREALAELNRIEVDAQAAGAGMHQTMQILLPSFKALYEDAKRSGIGIDEAREAYERASAVWAKGLPPIQALPVSLDYSKVLEFGQKLPPLLTQQQIKAGEVARAYKALGVTTQAELERIAAAATRNFELVRSSGTATPAEIRAAHEAMAEAVNAASGKIPTFWDTTVVPGVVRTLETLRTATAGSFAQMLLGAKSFGDGFVDVWESIKRSVLNIFTQIADAFIQKVLGKIIGSLTGSGGGIGSLIGGLVPGAGAAAGIPGVSVPLGAAPGAGAAGGGFLASGAAGVLGGAAAGVGGFFLGSALTGKYGKTAGAFGGAASGAATGALLGSVVPGLGTVVGGVLGGLGGLLGGVFGKSKGYKEDRAADQEIALIRAELIKTYGSMEEIRKIGNETGVDLAGAFGHVGKRGLEQFIETIGKFEGEYAKLKEKDAIPAGALGFPTKAQLEQSAKEAGEAYAYMRDSGAYTADVLQEAWDKWQAALQRSGDTGAAEIAKMREQMKALDSEYERVQGSIQEELDNPEYDEAGNRIYGVIEEAGLRRMEEIEKERRALKEKQEIAQAESEARLKEAGQKVVDEAAVVREGIERIFDEAIDVSFRFGPSPSAARGVEYTESRPAVSRGLSRALSTIEPASIVGPAGLRISPAPVILDGRTVGRVSFKYGVSEAERLGLSRRRF